MLVQAECENEIRNVSENKYAILLTAEWIANKVVAETDMATRYASNLDIGTDTDTPSSSPDSLDSVSEVEDMISRVTAQLAVNTNRYERAAYRDELEMLSRLRESRIANLSRKGFAIHGDSASHMHTRTPLVDIESGWDDDKAAALAYFAAFG